MDATRMAEANVREAMETSKLYRENCAAKHGLSFNAMAQRNSADVTLPPISSGPTDTSQIQSQLASLKNALDLLQKSQEASAPLPAPPPATQLPHSRLRDIIWPLIVGGGLTAGGFAANSIINYESSPPTPQETSLLNWLEERGDHLPPP